MKNIKMKNLLAENMHRFKTKNLHEQDVDTNDDGHPDDSKDSAWSPVSEMGDANFTRDLKQEKANYQWVADITDTAEKHRNIILEILKKLGYTDPRSFNATNIGFEIRKPYNGQFGYRGFIFLDLKVNSIDYDKIGSDPEFKQYFQSIQRNFGRATTLANSKLATAVEMKPTPLPN